MLSVVSPSVNYSVWALEVFEDMLIAVGNPVFAEYLVDPKLYRIPGAVDYCQQVLLWRDKIVPVFDFSVLHNQGALNSNHLAVLAYQDSGCNKVNYLAVKLSSQTSKIEISDADVCDWPAKYSPLIEPLVSSLFIHNKKLVSMINLSDLCNEGYKDYVMQVR